MVSLCVIIPIFNEEKFLLESLRRIMENDIYEQIILVDDCSTDNSSKIAKHFASSHSKARYLKTSSNSGKGAALALASKQITTSHVVIHDADLEYFPVDIIDMFELAKKYNDDLILGSRFIGKKERENIYLRTFLANKIMSQFFSLVNLYKVTDVATCYKLMPSKFFKEIELKEKGFSIEIEVLSKFLKHNKSIKELPISYVGRSYQEGKKIKAVDGLLYLFNTLKYKFLY